MQLSKLEIKGFKSFGEKIIINFDAGITGIVGPNGCGKSNVVDAIRWVLGEQKTRNLRSDKMENIIFNGTKNRKALQMAEVSLTFNNTKNLLPTEYSQVTITRKYYRTGESEYLLNNVTCRLKDINNLFLDTGIGPDSYAIIELKMVDDILNDKDNSRRGLFEEAAGISKFKIRKKESLRKLEDTDQDLERLEDVLFEISKNLKMLEKQAKQAQTYFKLKEEYKHWSVILARQTVRKQSEAFVEMGKRIEAEQSRKISLQTRLAEKEAALEKEKAELVNKEKRLASRQKTLNESVYKIRQFENEKKIKRERLTFLTDKITSLQEQIEQTSIENSLTAEKIDRLHREKKTTEQQFRETEEEYKRLQEEYQDQKDLTRQLQEESHQANQGFRARQDAVYQLKKNLEIKQIQLSSLKQELERATSESAEKSSSLQVFDEKLYELGVELTEKQEELKGLQQALQVTQEEIAQLEKQQEDARQDIAQTNRTLDAKQNEYALTRSLVDNLEGFPEAIQYLKKHQSFGRQVPLLSDILTCPDEYRIAIENYLEPVMNYYVVPTEDQAYQAIGLLQQAKKGRAYFFVEEHVPEKQPKTVHPAPTGFIPAINVVEYDSKYQHLVTHLLENVYILPQNPERITENGQCIYLNQDGKLTRRQYSLSGGSVGAFEGKRIGRAKNLEILQQEIATLSEKIARLTERQQALRSMREAKQHVIAEHTRKIGQVQKEITSLSQEQIAVKTRQEQTALMLNNQAARHSDILDKMEQLQEEVAEELPKVNESATQLSTLEARINHLSQELMVQNETLSVKSSAYNQANIRFHQQQNKLAGIGQEIQFQTQTLQTNKLRLEKNTEELQKSQAAIEELQNSAELNEDELLEMYAEKERLESGVNEAEKDYYQSRGTIDRLEKETREIMRQRESADALLSEMQNKLNETKLQLTAVKERLSVEFNVNLDDVVQGEQTEIFGKDKEVLSEEELRTKVQEIKAKIDRIGPINPMALEAYEEIKQRYDFIIAQKQDLLNAKQSLLNTINEIDTVARENFMKAFNLIRDNFIKVFRSLFSEEDTCDLKLTDPDNPLDSTIDIMAKPKGKRPLTINQLSGGEKTLTAISLLFAIYLLKPAPFCIFDEVDAPLDDANIDKFNNIIRKFASESQFIIVTHNKRTMSTTDVIYGITMIEAGVSTVVPVDLRELA